MNSLIKKILELDYQTATKFTISEEKKLIIWITRFFAHSGDSWYCLAFISLIWIFGNKYWHDMAAVMAISTVFLAIFVLMIKFLIRRKRPEGEWGSIYRNTDPHSFPSGHATRVFFLASLSWLISPVWLAILLTIWAPIVAASRVFTGVHYLSDIMAGAILGWFIGKLIVFLIPMYTQFLPFLFSPNLIFPIFG